MTTSAALVLTLLGGIIATKWQALRAARAEARAVREAAIAVSVGDFLQDVISAPTPAWDEPVELVPRDLTVDDLLDYASRRVDVAFTDQPEVEAAVRVRLGDTYRLLTRYEEAEQTNLTSVGPNLFR